MDTTYFLPIQFDTRKPIFSKEGWSRALNYEECASGTVTFWFWWWVWLGSDQKRGLGSLYGCARGYQRVGVKSHWNACCKCPVSKEGSQLDPPFRSIFSLNLPFPFLNLSTRKWIPFSARGTLIPFFWNGRMREKMDLKGGSSWDPSDSSTLWMFWDLDLHASVIWPDLPLVWHV